MPSPSGVVASAAPRHRAGARVAIPAHRVSPTSLRLADLLRITDEVAADVLDGHYADVVPQPLPAAERWSLRIRQNDEVDVWLISWVPDRSTELHDHAGSLGALTVVRGALDESRWTGRSLKNRRLAAGDQAAFPLGWVHDVSAAPGGDLPALSVHAYSPPLTAMSYYRVLAEGRIGRTRSELTTEPEAVR